MWFFKLLSLLPWRVLYGLSDLMSFVAFRVLRYRVEVVKNNLRRAFPELSEADIHRLSKRFYRNLSDILVETLKLLQMKETDILNRVHIQNIEALREGLRMQRPVVILTTHQGNWEWLQHAVQLHLPGTAVYFVYQQLSNPFFDRLMLRLRSRFGAQGIEMKQVFRKALMLRREPVILALLADQSPRRDSSFEWVSFFNEPVAFFNGGAKLATKLQSLVVLGISYREKRGYYRLEFSTLSQPPYDAEAASSITQAYAKALEDSLQRQVDNWLWSHKRWKLSPPAEMTRTSSME
jgi:KDO2-lipid IV(A) lauroyltransferase